MCRRRTPAPKELQVGGSKPSGGSSSQTVGMRANDKFGSCTSGVRIPAVASISCRTMDAASTPEGFRGCLSQLLAPPEHIDPPGKDVQDWEQHVHSETQNQMDEGNQDGSPGQARPQEHPAPPQTDQGLVQVRVHQM